MSIATLFNPRLRELEKAVAAGRHRAVAQIIYSASYKGDEKFLKAAAPIVAKTAQGSPDMGIAATNSDTTLAALSVQDKLNVIRHITSADRLSDEGYDALQRLTTTTSRQMDTALRDAVTDKDVLNMTSSLLGHHKGESAITHMLAYWKYPSKDVPQAVQRGLLDLYSSALNRNQYGRLVYLVTELPGYMNEMTHFPPNDIVARTLKPEGGEENVRVILDPRVGQPLVQMRDTVLLSSDMSRGYWADAISDAKRTIVGTFCSSVAGNEQVSTPIRAVAQHGADALPVLALAGGGKAGA